MRQHRRLVLVSTLAVLVGSWALGAQAPAKRPLTYDVYDSWRSIQGTRLSDDGQWLAYALTSPGEDGQLVVRNLGSGQEFRHPRGTSPQMTPDNKFVVFTIVPPRADEEREQAANAQAGGTPPAGRGQGQGGDEQAAGQSRNSMGIMALPGGQVTTVERVSTFRLPGESSTWLAYHRGRAGAAGGRAGRGGGARGGGGRGGGGAPPAQATEPPAQTPPGGQPAQAGASGQAGQATPPEKRKDPGSDLIVRNLTSGNETTIPDVTEYQWDKNGTWLAYTVSSNDATKDGAFARRLADGTTRTLQAGKGHYKSLAFDEATQQLAFLSDQAEYDKPVSPYRLYHWKTADSGGATELVSAATRGMPQGMVVGDSAAPRFTPDGLRLVFGTAPPPAPPANPTDRRPAPIRVDLWSSRDAIIQPMQQVRAAQERTRSYTAVVHLNDKRVVQLATPDLPAVNVGTDPARAVGTSGLPYQKEISWDTTYNDIFVVDIKNGTRKKVLERLSGGATLSPGGNYLLYFDRPSGDWFTYHIASGTRSNLTDRLPVKFFDETHDTPDLPGSLGSAGWTDGDKSLLLYDRYDIWEMRPDGTNARMITNGEGRKQNLVFRYRTFDTEERTIPTTKPMLLSTVNDATKATGYYRVNFTGTAAPEKIVMLDKALGAPTKAKKADVIVFTQSRFDEFPDLWVSNTSFAAPKKVTNANPQQAEFVWGKAENIKYINADGKVLTAMLIKPDNFDPSKKYPMMVYIYEELSQGLHGYRAPNVGTSVNLTRYVSNGYVVLQPDIVYETGYPGPSAMKCVIPAINTVVAQGYIDPKRIGIQGHSWGGYQITYMITQTNLFAAVQAGASVSNMISAYGGIRWGSGMVRSFQYERTQSRIGAPPWDKTLEFIENSPIFWVERINTPYLSIHNDGDDAVPWYQGIEFNMAMRRLGKEAYMFNYNGEPHGLRNRDNMKHWTVHMDEFFDHYLLGKPRPEWMDKGVSFLEKGTRDVRPLFKKAVVPPAGGGRN
jgi:dipeptidyl aminopeptidase/acylaminoacyl peptidase